MTNLYENFKASLEKKLLTKEFEIDSVSEEFLPLFLLLKVGANVVGFACLNNNPKEEYQKAVKNLKSLYVKNSNGWINKDLCLVLCNEEFNDGLDNIYSEIEQNSNFCRKFVISTPVSNSIKLNEELNKLPFFPLESDDQIFIRNPLTAQSFLQKNNTTSKLAEYLIKPGARSKERIVEDCLNNSLGVPEWRNIDETDDSKIYSTQSSNNTRITGLEINNFRAYSKAQYFNLDADLIILYGPNGLGKTSFYDAIDFACTGSVGRFDERKLKAQRLNKALKHLDCLNDDQSYVKLEFKNEEKVFNLKRTLSNKTTALINDKALDRIDSLVELTKLDIDAIDIRTENLLSLFRASHLFGQDFQNLTNGFKNDSSLSEEIVSRMLAMQDYVEGIKKSKEVYEELGKFNKNSKDKITSLQQSISQIDKDLIELKTLLPQLTLPIAIEDLGKKLIININSIIQEKITIPEKFNQEACRSWRTIIDKYVNQIRLEVSAIEYLENGFISYNSSIKYLSSLKLSKEEKENKSKEEITKLQELDKNKSVLEFEIKEFDNNIKRVKQFINTLSWLSENVNIYHELKKGFNIKISTLKKIEEDSSSYPTKIEFERIQLQSNYEKIKHLELNISKLESEFLDLEKILNEVPNYYNNLKLINNSKGRLEKYKSEEMLYYDQLKILKSNLHNFESTEQKYITQLEGLQKHQSELQTILDELNKHVTNEHCPACGVKHDSMDSLREKISNQKKSQPVEINELYKSLKSIRIEKEKVENDIRNQEQKIKGLLIQEEEANRELNKVESFINYFYNSISKYGFNTNENLISDIQQKSNLIKIALNEAIEEIERRKTHNQDINKKIEDLKVQNEVIKINISSERTDIYKIETQIKDIEAKSLSLNQDLNISYENIIEKLNSETLKLEELQTAIKKKLERKEKDQHEESILKLNIKLTERDLIHLDEKITAEMKSISSYEETLSRFNNLNRENLFEDIKLIKEKLNSNRTRLAELLQEVISFEIALDSAQASAREADLIQNKQLFVNEIDELNIKVATIQKWQSFFKVIQESLAKNRNEYLSNYTKNYGPIATIIQNRLRTVYGFGDLIMGSEGGKISVKVERKDQNNLFPTDYFSESQTQIVTLSLFLSASITQTWSKFSPIILDDPITHFDDLNAYSFLDLIRGIVENSNHKNQFIISTCDERLFLLMQQKFRKMDGSVIFYKFKSIGENGPEVEMEKIDSKGTTTIH